ncbi:MAG: hypothetical protein ABI658_05690 [Acidimicrobiales bacterium]
MQRKKFLLAATIISALMLTGAVAYAANGVFDGRDDNVGNLDTTAIQPTDVGANPSSSVTPPPTAARPAATAAVTAPASAAVTARPTDDSGHDSVDDIGDDHDGDRRHGRDGDDD